METWSLPVKSVFVTFPGDVIKNMTDMEMANVSSRWHDHLFKDRFAFPPQKKHWPSRWQNLGFEWTKLIDVKKQILTMQ